MDLFGMTMFGFSAVLILLPSVKSDIMGLKAHWSMDFHNDVILMPDYGNETRFYADLPSYSGHSYFTAGIIGEALSLSGQKVNLISNVRRNDCLRNPIKCGEGLSIAFWLYLKRLTRKDYQVILRSTNFDASGPGIYIGGDEDESMMRFLLRTAAGVEYSRKLPWSKVQMKWCHLVLKWNSSHELEVFLNGSSVSDAQSVTHGLQSYPTRSSFTAGDVLGPVLLLDDVWLFYSSLPEDTIHKIYELGLPAPYFNLKEPDNDNELVATTTALLGYANGSFRTQSSTAAVVSEKHNNWVLDADDVTPTISASSPYQRSTTAYPLNDDPITTEVDLPLTKTSGIITKRSPATPYPLSPAVPYHMDWFYNQTWYHVFIGITFLVLLAVSAWLCTVHCLLPKGPKKEYSEERIDSMDTKPFLEKSDYV